MAKTVTDFSFSVENRPGGLATVAELLAKEDVNLNGGAGFVVEDKGVVHVYTNNPQATERTLDYGEITYESREVFEASIADKPGELAKLARALADAGVNIDLFYITMRSTLIVGVDNSAAARQVFQKLGI